MKHIGTQTITTQRLILRQFTLDDIDAVYKNYGSDEKVNRYISFAPCFSKESTQQFIQMHIKQYASNPAFYGWAITVHGEVIGSVGLFNVDDADQCELGYSLGSRWWNQGYTTEAAQAVLDYAFHELNAHRVYASHHIDNIASEKVLQKIGMKYEGTMREAQKNADGTYSDLKLYAKIITD